MRKVKKRWVVAGVALTVVGLGSQSVAADETVAVSTPATDTTTTNSVTEVIQEEVPAVGEAPEVASSVVSTSETQPIIVRESGSYTFTDITPVKNAPKQSSVAVAYYDKGETVNYDQVVTNENQRWLSYSSYSGVRRYVPTGQASAPKAVTPKQPIQNKVAKAAPTSQPAVVKPSESKVQSTTRAVTVATQPSVPSKGSYTFKTVSSIKNAPKVSSQIVGFYNKGESVNYDSVVTGDNHHWLSYVSRTGVRRYIALEKSTTVKQVPVVQKSSTPTTPTKVQPTSAKSQESKLVTQAPKPVNNKTQSVQSTAAKPQDTKKLESAKPQEKTKEVVVATKPSVPQSGSYTFKVASAVKDAPKVSSQTVATYEKGQKVNYDSIVTSDNHHWLSYIARSGIRRYIALEKATTVKKVSATENTKSAAQPTPAKAVQVKSAKSASQGAYDVVNKVIYLDAGHGGSDPGAMYYGLSEKNLNLDMQNRLKAKLEKQGYKVVMTSAGDTATSLIGRSQKANASNADIFISIHYNAAPNASIQGIETYYYQDYKEYPSTINKAYHTNAKRLSLSNALATAIQNNVVASSKGINRGVKRNTFSVLRETTAPSVLLELGYLSNRSESNKIKSEAYREKLANGIVNGINAYYKKL